jgi:hypothetical protein
MLKNVSNREARFLLMYYLVLLSILVPLCVHTRTPNCWPICRLVNEGSYAFSNQFGYSRHEIWELFGVLQAVAVSVLLFFEIPDDKTSTKYPVMVCGLLVVLGGFAAYCLGAHQLGLYQILLILLSGGFLIEDWLLRKKNLDERSAKDILYLVDLPVLVSLAILTWYVRIPVRGDDAHFFSGAIAFQFIMGNVLLVTIRTRVAVSTPPARAESRRGDDVPITGGTAIG